MKVEAMIDRFTEKDQAVVLAENIGKEFLLEKAELPEAAKRGDYLIIELNGEDIHSIEIDKEKTKQQQSSVTSKLEQIRAHQTGSRFRKK